MYVSVVAQKDNVDIESKKELKLTDSKGKRVKSAKVSYDENNGAVISTTDDAVRTEVETVSTAIINSTMTEIDISGYADMPSHVQKAFKTSGGNYMLELRAAGYGINGDKYTRSNEYITINVSITAGGKIIACKTVSQKESSGIGDACAKPEFYNQFNGKVEADYGEIDAIGGATITTNGYKSAIASAFTAVKILKGGAWLWVKTIICQFF